MSRMERRTFSREFKLGVIARLGAGESGSALALEFEVKRTIIYRWRATWRRTGRSSWRAACATTSARLCARASGPAGPWAPQASSPSWRKGLADPWPAASPAQRRPIRLDK